MTPRPRPAFHPPARRDPAWMEQAACTPAPAWTSDYRPRPPVMRVLSEICDRCPVQSDCARTAVEEQVTGGVYAGVYLPSKHGPEWVAARDVLRWKAGMR